MVSATQKCVRRAFRPLMACARLQMMSTWVGYAQLIDALLDHPDLVPDVDSCLYLHHRVGVPLLAAVKGQAVHLLIWLDDSMVCLASPASRSVLTQYCIARWA